MGLCGAVVPVCCSSFFLFLVSARGQKKLRGYKRKNTVKMKKKNKWGEGVRVKGKRERRPKKRKPTLKRKKKGGRGKETKKRKQTEFGGSRRRRRR